MEQHVFLAQRLSRYSGETASFSGVACLAFLRSCLHGSSCLNNAA